uniref:Fungal lipase-like domain-containing protein n=1 Tax=Panagrolaimus davidi TaxID=227884 RepID=A0A914PFV0_9BILA
MVRFVGGGRVGKTFLDGFNSIWLNAGMKYDVYTLKNRYPNYDYYIVGHSLGGAMASLAAATIVATGVTTADKVAIFTFGQPRTGDKLFANDFNSLFRVTSVRIVHNGDIVSQIPSMNGTNYFHHVREFWYQNDMTLNDTTYVSCDANYGEDPNCSVSLDSNKLNFEDHKYYFGRDFNAYGIGGCQDLADAT